MARKRVAPPPQPAASSSGGEQEEEKESSYSSSQDQEVADKDKEEAVVEQPPSAVARSLPAIPKNRTSQPQGTSSSSEEDDDVEEVDLQLSKSVDHPVPAQRESEEGSDSSDSDDESGGSPNKDAVPDELARSPQKRAKAPAQHRGEEDVDPSDKALQPKKANEPSAELAKSPQKRAKAPVQHRGEEDDGGPSDMTPQPKKTKAPSAELAKSRQKRVKAAHHRGEVDGDPSDKAPQPKKTNVPSAELAKSPPPKKKNKKAPAQQLGEEEVQTADSSNSEPGETAPHRDPLSKRNVLHSHRPAAPKRRKEAPPKLKSKRVRRTWAPDDEAQILEALAEHRREHGHPPPRSNSVFFDSLAKRLEDKSLRRNEIKDKVNSLRRRYLSTNSVPTAGNEQLLYDLSIAVWGDMPTTAAAGAESGGSGGEGGEEHRDFDEMCGLYPHLAHEVKVLAELQPTVKASFPRLDDRRARVMEAKLEKVSWAKVKMQVQMEIKVQVPTAKVRKELVNLLMEMR